VNVGVIWQPSTVRVRTIARSRRIRSRFMTPPRRHTDQPPPWHRSSRLPPYWPWDVVSRHIETFHDSRDGVKEPRSLPLELYVPLPKKRTVDLRDKARVQRVSLSPQRERDPDRRVDAVPI